MSLEQLIEKREELSFQLVEARGQEQFKLLNQLEEIEAQIEELEKESGKES